MAQQSSDYSLELVSIKNLGNKNLIFGQAHFIKTVEDIHETLVTAVSGIKFGMAFSEASGPCLIRTSGTDESLSKLAAENLLKIAAGHTFLIFLENAFPVNVLNAIKSVPEVVRIYCATANPVQVLVARSGQGGGIMGIIDGSSPKGIEDFEGTTARKDFLRKIGYKL